MSDHAEGLSEVLNLRQGWNRLTGERVMVDNRTLRAAPDVYTDVDPTPAPAPVVPVPVE